MSSAQSAPIDTPVVTEQWRPARRHTTESIDKSVTLTGAPAITADGGPRTPVSITFRFSRINGGPWQSRVTIYADRPGHLVRKFFSPDKVYQPPAWLTDVIARATPED